MALVAVLSGMMAGLGLSVLPVASQTEIPAGADGSAIAAADVVAGILSYTRWPDADGPVRLCVAGGSPLAARMGPRTLVSGRALVVSRRAPGALPGEGCDAVFVGGVPPHELGRIARASAGQAIITMTDDDPDCGSGMMLCLRRVGSGMSFDLNIDAVSRSRVRIDPRVLSLSRGRP